MLSSRILLGKGNRRACRDESCTVRYYGNSERKVEVHWNWSAWDFTLNNRQLSREMLYSRTLSNLLKCSLQYTQELSPIYSEPSIYSCLQHPPQSAHPCETGIQAFYIYYTQTFRFSEQTSLQSKDDLMIPFTRFTDSLPCDQLRHTEPCACEKRYIPASF